MPLPPAPCGKADTCEHCPYPDCRYDGLSAMEYKASYSADADARHSNMDKRASSAPTVRPTGRNITHISANITDERRNNEMNEKTKPNTPAAKLAALLYTMRKSNLTRDCDLPGVPGYTRIWRGSRSYGRLLLIGWRRGKPASLTKDLAEELAREWAAEEVL